jgi:hypothetical protein
LDRALARWTQLYPDVDMESVIVTDSVDGYLRNHGDQGQLLVTDSYRAEALCHAGHSVLAIRCSNL